VVLVLSSLNLLRLGGLAALLGGTLVVTFNLVSLASSLFIYPFGASGFVITIFYILSLLSLVGQALILLGLVGLYVRQARAVGIVGLISFLLVCFGTVLGVNPEDINWGAISIAYLGWALFGVFSLRARIYPRIASIVLSISALCAALFTPLTVILLVVPPRGSLGSDLLLVGLVASIVSNVTIAWLGCSLCLGRAAQLSSPR
jgi:hypothetical protein